MKKQQTYAASVLLLVAASCLWSLNGLLIKTIDADGEGPSSVMIAFFRSLFAGLFLLPLARPKLFTLVRSRAPEHAPEGASAIRKILTIRPAAIWCVLFFTVMTVCFVHANTKTEAANAIILQYTSTFWIFGLSPWVVGERPHARDIWILALAVVGIGVIFVGNASTSLVGLLNGLAAGLFFALLTLMIRRLRNADAAAVTVLNNLGSAALILPFALYMGEWSLGAKTWALLVLMGVIQFGLPYYLFSLGLKGVPAYQAGLITLIEPVLVPIWTYIGLGETVPRPTMIGGVIILAALMVYGILARRRMKVTAIEGSAMVESTEKDSET